MSCYANEFQQQARKDVSGGGEGPQPQDQWRGKLQGHLWDPGTAGTSGGGREGREEQRGGGWG